MNKTLEFKRQLAHVALGIFLLWGIHFNIFTPLVLGAGTLVIAFFLFLIKKGIHIPIFYPVLCYFERKDHLDAFPGRGLLFFLLGAFLTVSFFEKHIVMAALSILLVGDAVTNLAGYHFGYIKNPLNKQKTIEGTMAGIVVSFAVCSLFFPFVPSLLTAIIAMIIEIPKLSIGKIPLDDNVTIPLGAAFTLYLFSLSSLF